MKVTLEGNRNMYVDGADNAEVLPAKWRNFRGEKRVNPKTGKVINDEGARNFNLALNSDVAQALADLGANVKVLEPRTEEEEPLTFVQVKVNTNGKFPPTLHFVKAGGRISEIPVGQYNLLDVAVFENVDLVINLYHPEEGKTTLYLDKGYFTLKEDPITAKYRNYVSDVAGESVEEAASIYGEASEEELPFA